MVHDIFHAMFEIKESRLCCCIHVFTEAHDGIFKIIAILGSDVHETTNPMIQWFSMLFLNFSAFLKLEVYPWGVSFQKMYPLEMVIA